MAVELMGNGDKVSAQMNRTVFLDVPSTHWARGYINVATQVSAEGGVKAFSPVPSTTPKSRRNSAASATLGS